MIISTKAEYEAAAERANALSDAPEGSPAAAELAALVCALRKWDEVHAGENAHGPEANPEPGTNRSPDDLLVSGLPGNLGKLKAD
ncbi:hypothetical protein ASE66_24880 [Bosea sp. Root483D1]|uniref:hypothetical protein n=1 Tax=Bosea sp. Root483D1 TaxID=1736544 RepID=UPI00070CF85F|nr:hypothetical protein [Bosea sp. Root483D1]KRE11743.1 hypothetical protein ASE66_24880 [Bosea sp. Root483D1]